jgi:predicted GTPase
MVGGRDCKNVTAAYEEERRLNVRSLEAAVFVSMAGRRDTTRNAGSSICSWQG